VEVQVGIPVAIGTRWRHRKEYPVAVGKRRRYTVDRDIQ
jgi:hypothetical protein